MVDAIIVGRWLVVLICRTDLALHAGWELTRAALAPHCRHMSSAVVLTDSGGPSGEDLRFLAIEGMHDELRRRLSAVANTCSADDLGLTPLHYAVWNGHVECVKLLIANHQGIDKDGNRCSSLTLR
jgi:hypothetical protein